MYPSYTPTAPLAQAPFNHPVDGPSPDSLIEQYRTSPRGDFRATAAIVTIAREWAAADHKAAAVQEAAPASLPVLRPAISAYADDGWNPDTEVSEIGHACATGDTATTAAEAIAVPAYVARNAIAATWQWDIIISLMRKTFMAKRRTALRRPTRSSSVKPLKRTTAIRSPSSHGGARRAGDDGAGSSDGPDPNLTNAVYWRADGEAMWRGKSLFAPLPKPRRGYTFVNANCECWRRKFSNLFCSKCTPVDRRRVPLGGGL